jgi:hypothetical protein
MDETQEALTIESEWLMSKRIGLGASLMLAMITVAACGTDPSVAPDSRMLRPHGANPDIANLTQDSALFSQTSTSNGVFDPGQDFTSATYLADDFVVPAGQVWTISSIVVAGRVVNGTAVNHAPSFFVLTDDGGHPSLHVPPGSGLSLTASDPQSCCDQVTDYLLSAKSGPFRLGAGTYWLGGLVAVALLSPGVFDWQTADGSGGVAMTSDDGLVTWRAAGLGGLSFSVFGHAQLTQAITFPAITPNPATPGTSAALGATATSQLPITYTSSTNDVCIISGTSVQFLAAGTCTVTADQAGDTKFAAADQQTQSVDVHALLPQTIAFLSTPPSPAYINGKYTVNANGGMSGNTVVVTVAPSSVCTVMSNVVNFVGVGACTITANQAGNATYAAAQATTQTVDVAYHFGGFEDPVKSGVLNVTKTGRTIPLKWRLTDASGAPITNLSQAVVTVTDLSCTAGSSSNLDVESASGSSGLQNLGNGYYQFNWKAPSSYANSCKLLQLTLGEGIGARTAQFQFTK